MKFILLAIFLLETVSLLVNSEPVEDKQALLDFVQNIFHGRPINWDANSSVCSNWTGVTCDADNLRVIAVRLPGFGFLGPIPSNTLSRLSALEVLSLRSNAISGPIPSDFSNLGNLTALYLQSNDFVGPLPLDFTVWNNLAIINLSNNGFNGSIPSSIGNLTHLTALYLANNSLSGEIPNLNLPTLQAIDLSNNDLTGTVPRSLQRFPSWAFLGNNLTTDNPVPPLPPTGAQPQPSNKSSKLSESAILGIVIGCSALGFGLIAILMVVCYSGKEGDNGVAAKPKKKEGPVKKAVSRNQDASESLVFFEGCSHAFDLEDLLRASAEVLGKGTFGTTYKASLEDTMTVVVKRLKEVSVAKREFEQEMEVVAKIRHQNVAALKAYYYSKDEKLMVYDYFSQGSISSLLHGMLKQISHTIICLALLPHSCIKSIHSPYRCRNTAITKLVILICFKEIGALLLPWVGKN